MSKYILREAALNMAFDQFIKAYEVALDQFQKGYETGYKDGSGKDIILCRDCCIAYNDGKDEFTCFEWDECGQSVPGDGFCYRAKRRSSDDPINSMNNNGWQEQVGEQE